jgi:exonuclease SbcC
MIPLHLSLSGFLSYRDPVEVEFTSFDLACITGPNGAGKSSLLDAITWALFGQARKRDDSLINTQSNTAEVSLIFKYEGSVYRVQRINPRGKTSQLEFQIMQEGVESAPERWSATGDQVTWKPLTERTIRETQACIEDVLSLDFETFVNASFFLQGKADQFTQQRPGDRKRILSSILGLDVWESYRQRTAGHRRTVEAEISSLDGRLSEINAELGEESTRVERLKTLQSELEIASKTRTTQESALENIRLITASLDEQRKLVSTLARQLEGQIKNFSELETRAASRREEREGYNQMISRAEEIEAAYKAWEDTRTELEKWDEVAARFREHEKRRQEPLDEINAARAGIEAEGKTLLKQVENLEKLSADAAALQPQLESARKSLRDIEAGLGKRAAIDTQLSTARKNQAEARAENPRLKEQMDDLKGRIDKLADTDGAVCPTCGQPLSPDERQALIDELGTLGKALGDKFRTNKTTLDEADKLVTELESQFAALAQLEDGFKVQTQVVSALSTQLEGVDELRKSWEVDGFPRLNSINAELENETYASEARAHLAEVDAALKEIGYDAAAHDALRRAEVEGRKSGDELRGLEKARAALAPLEREIADLESQVGSLKTEIAGGQKEHDQAAASLAEAEAKAPDIETAERDLLDLQESENRLRLEVGAAQQKVLVLDDLKKRRTELDSQREGLARQVGQYRQLERAFSKDGVPALLIEQSLPQIENKANEVIDRLSGGEMSLRFVTQAAYKDKRRDDLRETLEIQISDSAGMRDYEMFSGGEAFRVNFAIRLALSEVLAQRAGARLQTLVIDEGFGSQDALGRQRLVEAINLVRQDFAKILVITHIDELKDAFPTRIEVEKTARGSTVQVV